MHQVRVCRGIIACLKSLSKLLLLFIIIPKPNKEDKKDPKAYRPISLLNYLGKILEKIIATRLGNLANLSPPNTPINLLYPS